MNKADEEYVRAVVERSFGGRSVNEAAKDLNSEHPKATISAREAADKARAIMGCDECIPQHIVSASSSRPKLATA